MAVASSAGAEDQQARLRSEMDTRALSRAVGWLRPFVETMGWEYVVVWKIADDPSRFIEWVGCCCSGSICENVKEEKELYATVAPLCRDGCCKHYVRTRACEALSRLPSFMPLYSGIHGEVVIANEYRWTSPLINSTPNSSLESSGTQVLIPVAGGIIELFNMKIVPEEPKILELITSQCQLFSNQESMMMNLNEQFLENCTSNSLVQILKPTPAHFPRLLAPGTLHCSSYEGSSSSSGPSNEKVPIEYLESGGDVQKSIRQQTFSGINHRENILKTSCSSQEGESGSKNLLAERRRRNKIKERLFALRAIVPKISKMDRAAILVDAMDYIQELKEEIKGLQDELKKMEEEDCKLKDRETKILRLNSVNNSFDSKSPIVEDRGDHSCSGLVDKKEVQVEVKHMGNRTLLVRLLCEKTGGWFQRLMEVLCSLSLMVIDVNITTLNNKALTILRLEGQKDIYPKKLKDSLTKIAIS